MIDKGDILSIQYKMSLRWPKSARIVDGLSLNFIDFYAPVLTRRLSSTETSLQLSAVCHIYTDVISKETHTDTRCLGDRTEPCGTPACIFLGMDISPSTETLNFL
jgi:hypothetical protein